MRILFIDSVCAGPYQACSLEQTGLGGTEATVIRISEGLARRGHTVTVAQNGRQQLDVSSGGVRYVPYRYKAQPLGSTPQVVVNVRSHKIMPWLRRAFPTSRLCLWLHCFPGTRRRRLLEMAQRYNFGIVTVSRHHRRWVLDHERTPDKAKLSHLIKAIYNPVPDYVRAIRRPVRRDKLVFFSSPHKGLAQVLSTFAHLHRRWPELRLYVANPGYLLDAPAAGGQEVIALGPLTHHQVLEQVAEAFCVLYTQSKFAETFGLVLAEANALGTPVLCHPLGAAPEILHQPDAQLVNADDPAAVEARLALWRTRGRPRVAGDRRFCLERILDRWEEVLMRQYLEAA
ncbi:MAG: glycosyltransferase family 4 protein [Vulcanimicrobiota bacterium]